MKVCRFFVYENYIVEIGLKVIFDYFKKTMVYKISIRAFD